MAIFHMHGQTIKRSQGKSAVAAAAYRAGEKLYDERTGTTFDYSKKKDISYSEIMSPENVPSWVQDREKLWNEVEKSEKRKDSQVAREILIALPTELNKEQQIELVRIYCHDNFVSKGMIVDTSIHHAEGKNPHAHIMCTLRNIDENGFGYKNRDWNRSALMYEWRKSLADITNTLFLQPLGFDCTIDHRSLEARQLDLEPNQKLNPGIYEKGLKGKADQYEQYHESLETMRRNGDRIKQNPDIAIKKITQQQSVFTEHDMAKIANRCSADAEQFREVLAAIQEAPSLVCLGKNDYNREVFSSIENIKMEKEMMQVAHRLNVEKGHGVSNKKIEEYLHKLEDPTDGAGSVKLRAGQEQALKYILEPGDLKSVVGFAGSGKSFLMGVAKDLWEKNGFRVQGCALSGKATDGLQEDANIKSRTVDSFLLHWQNGRENLTKNDILVVDEAGMLNTEKVNRLLTHVRCAGAKIIMIGDDQQLQPIEAGAPFRAIKERIGGATLNEIVRQNDPNNPAKTDIMRQASLELETNKTGSAIRRYAGLGAINQSKTQEDAIKNMVDSWRSDQLSQPDKTQIMMGYTRADVSKLNHIARQTLIDAGAIKQGKQFNVCKEQDGRTVNQAFAKGDRIYFLRTEKQIGVKNGTLGTVERIKGDKFVVNLDGKEARQAIFNINAYNNIDYGYAATVHKAQGVTVDYSYLLASRLFDKFLSCVGMTRHRINLQIHMADTEFKDFKDFIKCMSFDRTKEMAIDYAENRGIEPNYHSYNDKVFHRSDATLSQDDKLLENINLNSSVQHIFAQAWENIKGIVSSVFSLDNGQRAIGIQTDSGEVKLVNYNETIQAMRDRKVDIVANEKGDAQICEIKLDDTNQKVDILNNNEYSVTDTGAISEIGPSKSDGISENTKEVDKLNISQINKEDDSDFERGLF